MSDVAPPLVKSMPSAQKLAIPIVANPFDPKPLKFTWPKIVEMAIVGVTLFPVRVVGFIVALGGAALFSWIATIGHDRSKPLTPLRRALLQPLRLSCRLALWSLGYWHIEVKRLPGSAATGKMAAIAAAPHYSLIDPFIIGWLELPCSVAKADVKKLPIMGTVAVAMQTIFVDRKDPQSKKSVAREIVERAKSPLWPPVLVFPEGTCTNGAALISFKAGPFLPGEPVQPIALQYSTSNGHDVSAASHDAEKRLLFAMFQLYNSVKVTYLPLHAPTPEELADKNKFAAAVRSEMADYLKVPTTAHSYEDVWLASKARRYAVKQTFEVSHLKSLFDLDAESITKLLERFHSLDTSGDGTLGIEEFTTALQLKDASPAWVKRLFSFFDSDDGGSISYAEFVQGLAILSPSTSADEKIKLAFLLCDVDAKGGVTLSNLLTILAYSDGASARGEAGPTTDEGDEQAATEPFVQRTRSKMETEFARFDVNGDQVLDYEEWKQFVAANPDILGASTSVMKDKLGKAGGDELLSKTVEKIKVERAATSKRLMEEGSTSPKGGVTLTKQSMH